MTRSRVSPDFIAIVASVTLVSLALIGLRSGAWGSEPAKSPSTATLEGVVRYRADPKRPWRFSRYYVRDTRLSEAVVALEVPAGERPPPGPAQTWTMDQINYQFTPETLAIRAGDLVRISNSDGALHNVMTSDGGKPFNVNVAQGQQFTHAFEQPGGLDKPVRLGCVFHGGMHAWIYVFDHPWFQVTTNDGRFRFEGIPPGKYTLGLAHPAGKLHWHGAIELKPNQTAQIEIALSPDDASANNSPEN